MRPIVLIAISFNFFTVAGCALANSSARYDSIKTKAAEAYENRRFAEAEKYYMEIVGKNPKDIEAQFRLGNIYAKSNKPEKAVKYYEDALSTNKDFAPAWRNLAIVRLRQGLAAITESQNHLASEDPLYIDNAKIIKKLVEVPSLRKPGRPLDENEPGKGGHVNDN